jgi:hypothetical protein
MTVRRTGGNRKRPRGLRKRRSGLPGMAFELAESLATPLRRTQNLVMALHFVGYGLSSPRDDAAPAVNGLAEALESHVDEMRTALGLRSK